MTKSRDQTTLHIRRNRSSESHRPRRYPVLIGLEGGMKNMRFTLDRERFTLGRSPAADIPIEDHLASRIHSSILYVNFDRDNEVPDCRIFDERSTNGTFVNGSRIDSEGAWLTDRDRIEIGKCVFGYYIRDEEELRLDRKSGEEEEPQA